MKDIQTREGKERKQEGRKSKQENSLTIQKKIKRKYRDGDKTRKEESGIWKLKYTNSDTKGGWQMRVEERRQHREYDMERREKIRGT